MVTMSAVVASVGALIGMVADVGWLLAEPVRWSIWNLAQIDCSRPVQNGGRELNNDCWLYLSCDPASQSERTFTVSFGADNPQFLAQNHAQVAPGVMGIHYLGQVGKVGVQSSSHWMAFANQLAGYVLCMQAPYETGAEYPDGGMSLECWTESPGVPSPIPIRSPGFLLEAEVLGPLCTLQPGEKMTLPVDYSAAYCPGPIVALNRAGCVHVPLQVTLSAGWTHIRGVFGCFDIGDAYLLWLDAVGKTLQRLPVAPVSPLRVLHIDLVAPWLEGTTQIWLQVVRANNTIAGSLGEVLLTGSVDKSK